MGATSKNQKSWIYFSSRKIIHSDSYLKNLLHMSNLILWTNYILWSCSTLKFWLTLNEFSRQNQDFKNRQLHPSDQTDGWILLFFRFHRACYTWPPNACAPHSRDHLPLCLEFQTLTRKRWKSIKRTGEGSKKNKNASKKKYPHKYQNKNWFASKKIFPWTSMELSKISTWYTHQKKNKICIKKK